MGKLAGKITKRIMASALSVAMIMSNMTVYAGELSGPAVQTEDMSDITETDALELPSTDEGTVQDGMGGDASGEDADQDAESPEEAGDAAQGDNQDEIAPDENLDTEDGTSDEADASEETDEEAPVLEDEQEAGSIAPVKADGARSIDVWDFGGLEEKDTVTYTNNITIALLKAAGTVTAGEFSGGTTVFGDLTITHNSSDRLYSTDAELSGKYLTKGYSNARTSYADYTAAGGYYCNGTGGSGRRHLTIANVKAGDKIVSYMGSSQSGDVEFIFEGQGTASSQADHVTVPVGKFQKCEFIAKNDGTYKIYALASPAGKPMYHRVKRVPAVNVSGTITMGEYTGTEHAVVFVNQTTKDETTAVLDGTSFSVALAAGYTYTAMLTGAPGYGFTNASKTLVTTDTDYKDGKSGVELVIEPKINYTYSGKITGFASDYNTERLAITMVPPKGSSTDEAKVVIDEQLNFTVALEPDVEYTILMTGVDDYEITSEKSVNKNANYEADITMAHKPVYEVTGAFLGLDEAASVNALTFTIINEDGREDSDYVYNAAVTGHTYSVNLRDGDYIAKATVENYTTKTHVVVDGAVVTKDLMFVSTKDKGSLTLVSDVYVGYPDKENNYATVKEAVEACGRMTPAPKTEAERIKVHIAPGTYREQIIVNTPYISFVNDTDKEVLLTWYYGIGYKYYSSNSKGYYDPEYAYDKYSKNIASKWGTAVYVQSGAKAFRAEGITFENSFNRYITDEEIADGVEATGESTTVARNYNADVQSKAATERATAISIEADQAEFKNCKFYSSQDTLYTGTGIHLYFKDCLMEGQTDYVFGDGDCVFDTCELRWKGYSTGSQGGYITAHRPDEKNGGAQYGYLFRNCIITANSKLTVSSGLFGRPWGKDARVTFFNTKLEKADLIAAAGWTEMSGAKPENANFHEYNTTTMAGEAVSTTGRVAGTVMSAEDAAKISISNYFGTWKPVYYVEEAAEVAFATKPFITSNGDLNTPYPGNTLTVGYSLGAANDANDASVIQWYSVKDGVETLLKSANAATDKKYKIASADAGTTIKVTVTPVTVSGNAGTPESCILDNVVREGWEDPDNTGGDVTLGDGVNIFLVGDSTVKDYSANGMTTGGTARDEGAWGEFFQSYFNKDKVTVVNYANGGRSSRNFINEGSLDKVAEKIGKGDYMFIQFGHNDCSNAASYVDDRYVPLGEPDAAGVYPTTPGTKKPTPTGLEKYGETCYTYDCGGTFKWYLQQYIDVAKNAGATPVLVTPVARMYYNSDGTIRPHHDAKDNTPGTQVTTDNAYVTAVRQLADEQGVLLVDGFELTKDLFENAYAAGGNDVYGTQIMHSGDKTHNNKLGGMIEAAAIATVVQNMKINISYAVKAPAQVLGMTTSGKTVFTVNANSKFTANDITKDYAQSAPYWEQLGQEMIDAIAKTAAEMGTGPDTPDKPDDPDIPGKPIELNEGNSEVRINTPVYEGVPDIAKNISVCYIRESGGGLLLNLGSDYTLTYTNADTKEEIKEADITTLPAGTRVIVTAKGIGNYTGSVSAEYTVARIPAGMGSEQYYVNFIIGDEWHDGYAYDAGSFITIPDDVIDDGMVVEGWYTDSSFSAKSKWDLRKNIVEKNMTLYGRVCTAETSDGLYVQAIPVQTYTGKDIKPAVVVYASDGKTLLKSGKDYTLAYANNKDANVDPYGEPLKTDDEGNATGLSTVTITGKGNYSSEDPIVKTFAIAQVNLDYVDEGIASDVSVKFTDQFVTKANTQKVLSSVKANKKALKAGTDFEAVITSYDGTALAEKDSKGLPLIPANAAAGQYTLKITGINNYAGTWSEYVYVADAANLMKNAKIKLGKNLKTIEYATLVSDEWTGWESKASETAGDDTFTVTGKNGVISPSDYDVYVNYAGFDGETAVGKAQLTIAGKGTYLGCKTIPFTVKGSAFSEKNSISIEGIEASRTYTSEALYQNDAIVKADGNELNYMYDYKITYKNNVKKGKATMTFTATPSSGYTGSIKKTFAINAATLKGEMIVDGLAADSTASAPKMDAMPYSKVALKPANKLTLQMIDQNYEGNTAADGAVLKEGTDYTVKYKDNNKVGTATITLKGKGSITGEVNVSFDIEAASLSDLYADGVVVPAVTPVQAKSGGTKDYAVKLKVLESGKALKAKKDYTLSLDKIPAADVNAYVYPAEGAARGAQPTVTVTGAGSYKDSIAVPLSFFDKADKFDKNLDIAVAPAVYNNGKQVTPGVTVTWKGNVLDECDSTGEGDYTVTYGKNNVAGKNKGSVTITGQGIYGGKVTKKFNILPMPLNGEIDELDTAFYYEYINDKIGKHLGRIQGKVDGIGTVTYEDSTYTFTVPVTDKTVNIDGTFKKLVDTYRNHPDISAGMAEVKDVFTADIRNAKEIVISATYVDSKGNETTDTRRRDPAKYIDKYENAAASSIIDDVLSVYEDRIKKYNNILGKDLKSYTLDKVAGKSGRVTVTINYKTGKAPVVLTYNVNFTDATAK